MKTFGRKEREQEDELNKQRTWRDSPTVPNQASHFPNETHSFSVQHE